MLNIGPRRIEWLSTLLRLKRLYLSDLTQGCILLLSRSLRFNGFHRLKLLGVTLCDTFRFDVHNGNVLKISQRVYLLKLLCDQGLPRRQLNTVFYALVLSRLRYALPVWSGFMSVEWKGQVNSFLERTLKCVFCSKLYTIEAIADDADMDLFRKMANPCHCVHSLLPPVKSCNHYLRNRGHTYTICADVTLRCIKSHLCHVVSKYM